MGNAIMDLICGLGLLLIAALLGYFSDISSPPWVLLIMWSIAVLALIGGIIMFCIVARNCFRAVIPRPPQVRY
jgi:hypothetical protein